MRRSKIKKYKNEKTRVSKKKKRFLNFFIYFYEFLHEFFFNYFNF